MAGSLAVIGLQFFQSYSWTLSSSLNFVPLSCKFFYVDSLSKLMRCSSLWSLLQLLAVSGIPFPVYQFLRFYWAIYTIVLERWEELMTEKHKVGPMWSSSHQKFLSKGWHYMIYVSEFSSMSNVVDRPEEEELGDR